MYKTIYNDKIDGLTRYIKKYNIKSLVLGVSGGADSTMTAVLARQAARRAGIKLIGVSLPSNTNKQNEQSAAINVCKYFCDTYVEARIDKLYKDLSQFSSIITDQLDITTNKIAEGNFKARLRMTILYHIAQTSGGIVLDTGNLSEHMMGFFTVHGDEGDVGLLNDMYKTEIYELGEWVLNNISLDDHQYETLKASLGLTPTDGNGTSSSDVEQFGVKSYDEVDDIIKHEDYDRKGAEKMKKLYQKSSYKRGDRPIFISKLGTARQIGTLFNNDEYHSLISKNF